MGKDASKKTKDMKAAPSAIAKELLRQVSKNNPTKKEMEHIIKYYSMVEDTVTPVMLVHKVMETLEIYLKTIQQILQPEEFHALYECNAFDDDEKGELFNMYKKAIVMHRELLKALILNDEKNTISTVKRIHEESLQLKPKMANVVDKIQNCWKSDASKTKSTSHHHYFG